MLLGAGASAEAGVPMPVAMTLRLMSRLRESPLVEDRLADLLTSVCNAITAYDVRRPWGDGLDVERVFAAVNLLGQRRDHELAPFVPCWPQFVTDCDPVDTTHVVCGRRPILGSSARDDRRDGPFGGCESYRRRLPAAGEAWAGTTWYDDDVNEVIPGWVADETSRHVVVVDPHFPSSTDLELDDWPPNPFPYDLYWALGGEGGGRITVVREPASVAIARICR